MFVAFLSSGDRLAPEAAAEMALTLDSHPGAVVAYSDEDWLDEAGARLAPRFKTDWDPDAQLGFDLIGRLSLMRRQVVVELGGLRPDQAPATHYDLHCRIAAAARPTQIVHVPAVLYHRKIPLPSSAPQVLANYVSAARSIAAELAWRTEGARVSIEPAPLAPPLNRLIWPLPSPAPLVSVIVPTRDRPQLLRTCARGVLEETDYPSIELLILDNDSVEPETTALFETLQCDPRVRILPVPGPFNYSRINNEGVRAARGEIVVLLNNDVEVIEPGWLMELASQAARPEIGGVGAKLLYGDRTIQHAGTVLAPGPLASNVFRTVSSSEAGHDSQMAIVRSYLAVTAACLAMRKTVYEEIGGFDEVKFKVAYSDVDLCLRLGDYGYRVVCTPFAVLLHLESASRGFSQTPEEIEAEREVQAALDQRWTDRFRSDPFHNPNTLHSWWDGLNLAAPRARKPWLIGVA
jgi:GT2 family glycosyltransferase